MIKLKESSKLRQLLNSAHNKDNAGFLTTYQDKPWWTDGRLVLPCVGLPRLDTKPGRRRDGNKLEGALKTIISDALKTATKPLHIAGHHLQGDNWIADLKPEGPCYPEDRVIEIAKHWSVLGKSCEDAWTILETEKKKRIYVALHYWIIATLAQPTATWMGDSPLNPVVLTLVGPDAPVLGVLMPVRISPDRFHTNADGSETLADQKEERKP